MKDDYSFEVEAAPGLVIIRAGAAMPASGLMLKMVRINGSDVTDQGIEVRPGQDLSDVEIVLTNTPPEVSGVVTNARGEPVHDYTVLVFAQDRDRWSGATRYMATARVDQDGRFKVRSLPPGQYFAVALEELDQGDLGDAEFLERAATPAARSSLGDAETKTLDLKLTALL